MGRNTQKRGNRMPKLTIQDYKAIIENQKKKIEYLENTIENFESIQRGKCCDCCEECVQDLSDLKIRCMPFEDEYFKNVSYEMIAQLAKKSIRLTSDNCAMKHKLEDIAEVLDNSEHGQYIKKIIDREN